MLSLNTEIHSAKTFEPEVTYISTHHPAYNSPMVLNISGNGRNNVS